MPRVAPPPRTFQDLLLTLQRYWAERGCVILQPYDMEVGAGTFHTATFLRAVGPGALERGVRAAVTPSNRRPLWRQPVPAAALLPVPGGDQAVAARHDRALPRFSACGRHRPARARRAPGGRQLGIAHARRLGAGLGNLVERHGSHAVHLLPAGGRARLPTRDGRDHLRARAPRDVPARRRERVRPGVGRRPARPRDVWRRVSPERGRAIEVQLRVRRRRRIVPAVRCPRERVPADAGGQAARCPPTSGCSRRRTRSTCSTRARRSR